MSPEKISIKKQKETIDTYKPKLEEWKTKVANYGKILKGRSGKHVAPRRN